MKPCPKHDLGGIVGEVAVTAAILVFIILPVFSTVMEKYVLMSKTAIIRDAVDMTNISAYQALQAQQLGKVMVELDRSAVLERYREMLCTNLKLDEELIPYENSVAEGRVEVLSLEIYQSGFPVFCPEGVAVARPSVHSCISVPIRPSLYRSIILNLLGKEYIDAVVHVDSEIPLNQ